MIDRVKAAYQALFGPPESTALKIVSLPAAGRIDPVPRSLPIGYDYDYGVNIVHQPRASELVTFRTLRNLAKNCDLIRIAIQMRKDQIRGLRWDIVVKPGHNADDLAERQDQIRKFFSRIDPENDHNFNDFMASWLEDLLVIDAAVTYVQKDRAGRLVGLSQVDGATVKPVITDRGYVPRPPLPAYAQVVDGSITGTFTRDEMIYCQYNPQADNVYGMSPVEMIITAAHISLKRQLYHLTYYTEGSVPDYLLVAPPDWNTEQIRQVQEYLDTYLSGNNAKRHKMKLVPSGINPHPMKQADFTTAVDEWLARIIAAAFNTAPHVLLKQRTKQQAEALEDQQDDLGLQPLKNYIAEFFTKRIIEDLFHEEGLAFSWLSEKKETEEQNLRRVKAMIPTGATGIDEVRESEGKAPLGVPPYIQLPNAIIFLTDEVRRRIASGELQFFNGDGVGGKLMGPEEQARLQASSRPQPAPGKPAAKPATGAKKSLAEEDVILCMDELRKWEKVARREPSREFVCRFLPEEVEAELKAALSACKGEDDVRAAFKAARSREEFGDAV